MYQLTVLGAGSILPAERHGPSGYALRDLSRDGWLLLDCGPGSLRSLAGRGLPLEHLEAVVLSHFHPDHCLDLWALAFALRNPGLRAARRAGLKLVGPRGLAGLLERGALLFGDRGWTRFDEAEVVEVDPAAMGGRVAAAGFELRHWPTWHTPQAVCWRATDSKGATFAYSGDSGPEGELVACAAGVDLFACECSFADEAAVEHHLTPSAVAAVAGAAGVRELLLTHFYPQLDPGAAARTVERAWPGPVRCAFDGLQLVRPRD